MPAAQVSLQLTTVNGGDLIAAHSLGQYGRSVQRILQLPRLRHMKRAREHEELLPPSPPTLSLPPALDRGKTADTDGRFAPAHDVSPYVDGTRDLQYEPCAKIASLTWDSGEEDEEGREQVGSTTMSCLLHRERIDFPTYNAYEAHYAKEHLNRCIECRRNFPSPRYLSLHGDEWHNPFVAVKRDRGEHTVC